MTKEDWEALCALDDAAEKAGGYVLPFGVSEVHYDYRAIAKYCKEKNMNPLDLTIRELQKFVIQISCVKIKGFQKWLSESLKIQAETVGFEPTCRSSRQHDFQSCSL